jgi:rRNA maturation RNase YbeY
VPPARRPAPTPEVVLLNPNRYSEVEPASLRPWLARLLVELAADADALAVRFVGDRAMRGLNSRYRGSDRTTDVLSFPGGETPEGLHLGDIAISVPAARRQAAEQGHSVARELRCLLLHGVLHCLGHDHETDAGEMRRLELRLRRRWVERDEVTS